MVGHLLGEQIRVRFECARDLGQVRVDAVQVQQAILNLATNARDAMPSGGDLTITVDCHREAIDGGAPHVHVRLTVSDTGSGVSAAVKERMFEPFFTTKTTGKGTGLGLAMVFSMMRQCGGEVRVESEPGRGTSFVLSVPTRRGLRRSPGRRHPAAEHR
jgi:signal transduction histidine kinase